MDHVVSYVKKLYIDEGTGVGLFLCVNKNRQLVKFHGILGALRRGMPLHIVTQDTYSDDLGYEIVSVKIEYDPELFIDYIVQSKVNKIGKVKARKFVLSHIKEIHNIDSLHVHDIATELKIEDSEAALFLSFLKNSISKFNLYNGLSKYGVSYKHIHKLWDIGGSSSIEKLRSDPYNIANSCGISFYIADRIAKQEGFTFNHPHRLIALLREAMHSIQSSGSTYTTIPRLCQQVHNIQNHSSFEEKIDNALIAISAISNNNSIIPVVEKEEIRLFGRYYFTLEEEIAKNLFRINVQKEINAIEYKRDNAFEYGIDQFNAIKGCIVSNGVKVITGRPGTGKTAIIKELVRLFELNHKTVALCAPTGRASVRITESTGYPSSTIHKLINIRKFGGLIAPMYNQNNKLPYDAIIVDEASMVGETVFNDLLNAVSNGTYLILVGDPNQLQSVEPGNVLLDIIESKMFPVYQLKKIYRQEFGNSIVQNSSRILEKNPILIQDEHFSSQSYDSEIDLMKNLVTLFTKSYDKNDPYSMQVIVPYIKDYLGKDNINKRVCEMFHSNSKADKKLYRGNEYVVGDKIMTTRNNYADDKNYMNGDIWTISEISALRILLTGKPDANGDIVISSIDDDDMTDIDFAYASTIHKSQGSEYDHVVIVLPVKKRFMLYNKIIYTAVTRAKKKVTIMYMADALSYAIQTESPTIRTTGLCSKIVEIFDNSSLSFRFNRANLTAL